MHSEKIIVGMSGGVDSSVAALLLKKAGYTVEGLFMKNWEQDDTATYCAASADRQDAQRVCDQLQIPLHVINFSETYWNNVFEHFLAEYRANRTPNPDILCNREIKFKSFLEYAHQLGATRIATGHYAQSRELNGRWHLLKSADPNKDQTYFLYTLGQFQLKNACFPIGPYHKKNIRALAAEAHLPTHDKKDSTGVCFIGERRFKQFLQQYLPAQPGLIETPDGHVVGRHDGLMYYTLGQRQGLGIGGKKTHAEAPWYVIAKDVARNVLIVAQGHDHPLLFKDHLICQQVHWISEQPPSFPLQAKAKIRYRQTEQACIVTPVDAEKFQVQFEIPQRAITPGQSIVFYSEDECLGGGIIE